MKEDRNTLKRRFKDGMVPDERDYGTLIDSVVFAAEDVDEVVPEAEQAGRVPTTGAVKRYVAGEVVGFEGKLSELSAKVGDKAYSSEEHSGLGRKFLTLDNGNILSQTDFASPNTIFIVQYDFDLGGKSVTIPAGSVLQFDGGSIANGAITFVETTLLGSVKILADIAGTVANASLHVDWFISDKGTDKVISADRLSEIMKIGKEVLWGAGTYVVDGTINVNSTNSTCARLASVVVPQFKGSCQTTLQFDQCDGIVISRYIAIEGLHIQGRKCQGMWNDEKKEYEGFKRGIVVNKGCSITNCDVYSFGIGIDVNGEQKGHVAQPILENINVGFCSQQGVRVMHTEAANVWGALFENVYVTGIGHNADTQKRSSNTGMASGHGWYILGGRHNRYIGCVAEYCEGAGVIVKTTTDAATQSTLRGCQFTGWAIEGNKTAPWVISHNGSSLTHYQRDNVISANSLSRTLVPDDALAYDEIIFAGTFNCDVFKVNDYDSFFTTARLRTLVASENIFKPIPDKIFTGDYKSLYYNVGGKSVLKVRPKTTYAQQSVFYCNMTKGIFKVSLSITVTTSASRPLQLQLQLVSNGVVTNLRKFNTTAWGGKTSSLSQLLVSNDGDYITYPGIGAEDFQDSDNCYISDVIVEKVTSLSSADRDSITKGLDATFAGLCIYDTDLNKMVTWSGITWLDCNGESIDLQVVGSISNIISSNGGELALKYIKPTEGELTVHSDQEWLTCVDNGETIVVNATPNEGSPRTAHVVLQCGELTKSVLILQLSNN